jgi:hypothetical protein
MSTSKAKDHLIATLQPHIPEKLAEDLADDFERMRQELATQQLGSGSPGKFVETVVQVLQHLERGTFDKKPDVDKFLRTLDSQQTNVGEGLKVCGSRVARAMYALRSKRNVVHKNDVDMNLVDLRMAVTSAQWLLSEIVRALAGTSMEDAGKLIEEINAPIDALVEYFEGRAVVLPDLYVNDQILVLLHSCYPDSLSPRSIKGSLNRRNPKSVGNSLRDLWKAKLVEQLSDHTYKLTQPGYNAAVDRITAATG